MYAHVYFYVHVYVHVYAYVDVHVYEAPHDGHRNIEVVNSRHQSGLYGMLQVQDIPFVTSPCMVICMTWFNNGQR